MTDLAQLVALASAGTMAVALASGAALKGWLSWLEVRRLRARSGAARTELRNGRRPAELSELRERVRRLEAIANGSGD